jgi:hypothetical protein
MRCFDLTRRAPAPPVSGIAGSGGAIFLWTNFTLSLAPGKVYDQPVAMGVYFCNAQLSQVEITRPVKIMLANPSIIPPSIR